MHWCDKVFGILQHNSIFYEAGCNIHIFFSFVCVWCTLNIYVHMYVFTYMKVCTHVCICMHRYVWGWCWESSSLLIHLIIWDKVSHSNSELTYRASGPSQLSPGILCFHLLRLKAYIWASMTTWKLCGFWNRNSGHLACRANAFTVEPSLHLHLHVFLHRISGFPHGNNWFHYTAQG